MKRSRTQNGRAAFSVLLLLTVAGCGRSTGGGGNATIQLADPGPTAEIVNGENVPERLLDALARSRNWDLSRPDVRDRALKELANDVLAAQAARTDESSKDADFAAVAEVGRLQALSAAAIVEFQKHGQIDDSALRAEYDRQIARAGGPEYAFTQIVFHSEDEAANAVHEIASGKPFDKIADAHKKDAAQMRSLTHVRAAQLPQPLAKALEGMQPGEIGKAPIQTPLGWYVVRLDAITPHAPPAFDQVKEGLRRSMLKRAGEQRMLQLRANAKITVVQPASQSASKAAPTPAPANTGKPAADDATKPKT